MKKYRLFAGIFLGIGIVFLILALAMFTSTRRLLARAAAVPGTVVELLTVRDNEGSESYKPVARFETIDGQTVTFTASFSSKPAAYDVGESVQALYLRDDPHEARIRRKVTVVLDSKNPKRYHMDVSFLPELNRPDSPGRTRPP